MHLIYLLEVFLFQIIIRFSSYWKRAVYRAGFHFENTGLEINNETINEFGISFGVRITSWEGYFQM